MWLFMLILFGGQSIAAEKILMQINCDAKKSKEKFSTDNCTYQTATVWDNGVKRTYSLNDIIHAATVELKRQGVKEVPHDD